MNVLGDTAKTFKDVETVAEKTILKTIEVLKEINGDESEIIEDINEQTSEDSTEDSTENSTENLIEEVREYINTLVSDANIVYEGIDQCATAIMNNKEISSDFLKKVWHGDMYDCDQIEGLKRLLYDLRKNLSLLTNDNIISVISNRLNKNSICLED